MKDIFVTTFNKRLYDEYAHQLVKSYSKTNQKIPLYIYVEDDLQNYSSIENVTYVSLFKEEPECKKFVERNKYKPKEKFSYDAVRFCYKVFAQNASRKYGDRIFYIDSDSVFMKEIPEQWYNDFLPPDRFLAFYDRPKQYTETGFLAFDNTKSYANDFFKHYIDLYVTDKVYNLKAYTDCHTLDATRKHFKENVNEYKEIPRGDGVSGHIMARDNLIHPYIDHRKGGRKEQKNSPEWLNKRS